MEREEQSPVVQVPQEKPDTVVPPLSSSAEKQKSVFPKRSLVVKAPRCLWYYQGLRAPVSIILLTHHSQTKTGTSHQNKE